MAKNNITGYRLRVERWPDYKSYIVREPGRRQVWYRSSSEGNLPLSALVDDAAAELRFKLEDAMDGSDAAKAVRNVLAVVEAQANPDKRTKITVLD